MLFRSAGARSNPPGKGGGGIHVFSGRNNGAEDARALELGRVDARLIIRNVITREKERENERSKNVRGSGTLTGNRTFGRHTFIACTIDARPRIEYLFFDASRINGFASALFIHLSFASALPRFVRRY